MFRFLLFLFLNCFVFFNLNNNNLRNPFSCIINKQEELPRINGIISSAEKKIASVFYKNKTYLIKTNEFIENKWKVQDINETFIILENIKTQEKSKLTL